MNDQHPGTTKWMKQCTEKYYFPHLAARIATHINQCMKCMQTKRTGNRLLTPPMINTSKLAMGPKDVLEMDIVRVDEPLN